MRFLKKLRTPFAVVGVVGFCALFGWWGRCVPFSEQWAAYDSLRQTAAILFGVLAVWIAVLHPQAVSQILSWRHHSKQVRKLVFPMLVSTAVVGFTLVIGVAAPAAKRCPVLMHHAQVLRGVSFGLLILLTLLLLLSLLSTLVGLDDMKRETESRADQERATQNMLPNPYARR